MQTYDVTILTDARYVHPREINPFVENVLKEDQLLKEALEKRDLKVQRINWDHPEVDWSDSRYILFRSTWDYFERFMEFDRWLERVRHQTSLLNPYALIRWNLDKHYLSELSAMGVPIPPTHFVDRGHPESLAGLVSKAGWNEIILKPAVSAAASHTYRFSARQVDRYESMYQKLIAEESMMIQEFQQQVPEKGEVSLIIIAGACTHAVLKKAKVGDFRVQDDFGGTVHPHKASGPEIAFAERVVSLCHPEPLYARVDMIRDNRDNLALSELELIEPELWFRMNPVAAERLAATIREYDALD